MKYIVIISEENYLASILMTNIIQNNLSTNKIDHEIILGLFNTKLCDSIYLRKSSIQGFFNLNNFNEAQRFLKILYSTKVTKTIVNLSSRIHLRILLTLLNRNSLKITISPKVDKLQKDVGKILNRIGEENDLKINHLNLLPREYISDKNIQKSIEYINWIMMSSGFKKIEHTKYLYVLLDSNNLRGRTKIVQMLTTFLNSVSSWSVIFSFYNFTKKNVDFFITEINDFFVRKSLNTQFVNCDDNIKLSLISQSKILITDNELYHYFSLKNDSAAFLLGQITTKHDETVEAQRLKNSLLHVQSN